MASEAQKRARNKYNNKNRITKTIAFGKNTEKDLIEFLGSLGVNGFCENGDIDFGTYIKDLIRKDMTK
jgi:hypothetical protein|uniref:Uncharacterized protein n=1 Tax=Siphoviridae sp. ctGuJ10 TaxID=2825418 RepID=A0A8S5PV41_9CAUD|nr:MAG TPA: hypothetical protein [Siphoviridae sp. ctGuJ10]